MQHSQQAAPAQGLGRRHYSLLILALVYSCNTMDRNVLSILLEPIRREFTLSDTSLGLLSGLSFAIFYALAGLPLGIAADRLNRRNMIVVCVTLWSGMTAICGVSRSFVQLLVARIGVGIGEAGGGPAAMAMISDLFPAKDRATAISAFYVASPLGAMASFAGGGWVAQHYGWRAAFLAAGVPGLILAVILLLTVREPRRGASDAAPTTEVPLRLSAALRFIGTQRSLLHVIAGTTLTVFVVSGVGTWAASFFIRYHGFRLAEIGPIMALATGAGGLIGTLAGGVIADRLALHDARWRSWTVAVASLAMVPMLSASLFVQDRILSALLYGGYVVFSSMWYGPAYGLAQSLVGIRMRGTIASVIYLASNLLGYGLGSQAIGLLSDGLAAGLGAEALRYAMLAAVMVSLWAALHFHLAAGSLRHDLARAN
jgi:predicted MFS family arabinose efflux permease